MSTKTKAPEMIQPRGLDVQAAARYLGATVWFVRSEYWAGRLVGQKLGNRLIFDRLMLDEYLTRRMAQ